MSDFGLSPHEQDLIRSVFRSHPEVAEARVFGSRAKGNAGPASDVDIVVSGVTSHLLLARIMGDLDDLPLPYRFDVTADELLQHVALREHIERVGKPFYRRETATVSP